LADISSYKVQHYPYPFTAQPTNHTPPPSDATIPANHLPHREPKKSLPCPPVSFLSDIRLKAVDEDEATQSTIITNNWERNVLLFRGKTATEIASLAKDQLLQLKSTGVKKFVVSIGTNDLLQLPLNSIEPKKAASRVVTSIINLSKYLSPDTQICAIIPGPTSHVSETAYEQFVTQMQRDLQEAQIELIHAGHVMDQSKSGWSYDELVQYTLTDGIHWKHAVASSIITEALTALSIPCTIKQSSLSSYQ